MFRPWTSLSQWPRARSSPFDAKFLRVTDLCRDIRWRRTQALIWFLICNLLLDVIAQILTSVHVQSLQIWLHTTTSIIDTRTRCHWWYMITSSIPCICHPLEVCPTRKHCTVCTILTWDIHLLVHHGMDTWDLGLQILFPFRSCSTLHQTIQLL